MQILDSREVSGIIDQQIKEEVDSLKKRTGKVPGLTVVMVGDSAASQMYIRTNDRKAAAVGIKSSVLRLDKGISPGQLIREIEKLNQDDEMDAVLIQLPLPENMNAWEIMMHLDPGKDVDRFHPVNLGMVLLNQTRIYPCTPSGILKILEYYRVKVAGMNAVVVGKSYLVGRPLAAMLTNKDATVTICHQRTKDLKEVLRNAELVVSAIGQPGIITADMIKPGAVLIDTGVNYLINKAEVLKHCDAEQVKQFEKKGYAIAGDIHRDAYKKASYYTPVPAGVGHMTTTMLMYNTLQLFKQRHPIKK
ncbi:MAG: bifunctional 5,10-methylenetetrahydrofolate dehydrogenase/5,10-methenyltetrahydrofolate cyclohydrolase [Candidatus Aminicenantes bacterium]|nr:MAG: bifunctional 5,10-methylenetetrahydrofolate dehydrogenase/5,10-methenyltetrahydrofolate cyclohydrolase [Candidatus Aminicenantes bacterium]